MEYDNILACKKKHDNIKYTFHFSVLFFLLCMCFHVGGELKRKINTDSEYTTWVIYGRNANIFIPAIGVRIS